MASREDFLKFLNPEVQQPAAPPGLTGLQLPEVKSFDERVAATNAFFGAGAQSGGTGVGGFLGGVLTSLDYGGRVVRSSLKETIDLLQGEGFSSSDWYKQVREGYGFGDILADNNVDLGLGGWGNRIVGFIGDVATDPLSYAGGLGVFARARGARGLIDDVTPELMRLKSLASKTGLGAGDTARLGALNAAVSAAGKSKSVSAARNALRSHGSVGQRLIDDLGIETGLRFRMPGTGPVLGRISRSRQFVGAATARRVSQVPKFTQDAVNSMLPKGISFSSLVRKASQGKRMDSAVPMFAQQQARIASRLPIEAIISGPKGIPLGGNFFAAMQSGVAHMPTRVATTRLGILLGDTFVGKSKESSRRLVREFARSNDPDKVVASVFYQRAGTRGSTMKALMVDEGQAARDQLLNRVQGEFGAISDSSLYRITQMPGEMVDDIARGLPVDPEVARYWSELVPEVSLKNQARIAGMYEEVVSQSDRAFLLRPDLYGGEEFSLLANQIDNVLLSEGGYAARMMTSDAIGGQKNGAALLKHIYDPSRQAPTRPLPKALTGWLGVDEAGGGLGSAAKRAKRGKARHLHDRNFVPAHVQADGELFIPETIYIPRKNGGGEVALNLRRSYAQSADGLAPQGGSRNARELLPEEVAARQAQLALDPQDPRRVWDGLGRTVEQQWDDALLEAGWLKEGESLFGTSFAKREKTYMVAMASDVELRAMEKFGEKQGLLFNGESVDDLFAGFNRLKLLSDDTISELGQLDDSLRATRSAVAARQAGDDSLAGVDRKSIEWLEKRAMVEGSKLAEADTKVVSFFRELVHTTGEVHNAGEEISGLVDELASLLGRSTDELLDGTTPRQVLDSAKDILPVMEQLNPIAARLSLLRKTRTMFDDAIDEIVSETRAAVELADAGMPQGFPSEIEASLRHLVSGIDAELEFIDEALMPLLSRTLKSGMDADKTVVAIKRMQQLLTGGKVEPIGPEWARLVKENPRIGRSLKRLQKFEETITEFNELDRLLNHQFLADPEYFWRMRNLVDGDLDALAAKIGEGHVYAQSAAARSVRAGKLSAELGSTLEAWKSTAGDLNKLAQRFGKTSERLAEVGGPFRGEGWERSVDDALRGDPSSGANILGIDALESTPLHTLVDNYDAWVKRYPKKAQAAATDTKNTLVADMEKKYNKAVTARDRIIERMNTSAGKLDKARAAQLADEASVLDMETQRYMMEMKLIFETQPALEQASNTAVRGAKKLLDTPAGAKFNVNDFGGSLDVSNMKASDLQDLFLDGNRTWGAWRIAGDDSFAAQFQSVMEATSKANDPRQVNDLLKNYDRMHNWLKAQMVATPGFIMRNVFGGMFNMWLDGIPLNETIKTAKMLQKAYSAGDGDLLKGAQALFKASPDSAELDHFVQLLDSGAHAGGQAASVVEDNLRQGRFSFVFGTKGGTAKGARVNVNPGNSGFVLYSGIRHANTLAEQTMRVATGLHGMRVGDTLEDSLARVYKLHFDYSDLSKTEQAVMKRAIPFYTWTRKNLPLQVSMMAQNPARYNRLLAIKRNLEQGEEREGVVPDYFLKPFGIQLPFSIGGSQVYTVPDLPFQDLFRFDPTQKGFGKSLEHLVSSGSPLLRVPIEYWAGKQVFANIPHKGRLQEVPTVLRSIPGLMPALSVVGWADKGPNGQWKMQDNRIAFMDGLMPYIGRMRRILPDEKRYQERWMQTLVSTFSGLNVRVNTPYTQRSARIMSQMERASELRYERDLKYRR